MSVALERMVKAKITPDTTFTAETADGKTWTWGGCVSVHGSVPAGNEIEAIRRIKAAMAARLQAEVGKILHEMDDQEPEQCGS